MLTNLEIDMNDPKNMEFFSKILLFKNNTSQEVLIFPPTLNPTERRIVHGLAHRLGLHHGSRGIGEQRQVHIFRNPPGNNNSPPNPALADAFQGNDGYRRNLNRAATTDFNEARQYESPSFNTLRGQQSVGMLQVETNGFRHDANLRSAKSFHDLRFRGPSPVSAGGYPVPASGSRLTTVNDTEASTKPTITPTTSHGLTNDEGFLINGVNSMNLGAGSSHQTSPPRRGRFPFSSWDDTSFSTTAPIGSNRTVSVNADNQSQERMAIRQPRGPGSERNTGFRRQNGRGSDELRNASSVIAE